MAWNEALREPRFWQKVRKTDTCWLWTGTRTAAGYGQLRVRYRYQYAHRFVLGLVGRAPGPDEVVCHRCDTPACVRPEHLFVGSHADNVRDRITKGRSRYTPRLSTHCRKGHELTPDNTGQYATKDGIRRKRCLVCHRAAWHRWNNKKIATSSATSEPDNA